MTKEEARTILEDWINKKTSIEEQYYTAHLSIELPIDDEVVFSGWDEHGILFEQWTFKGLIKIAYDLQDKV